MVDESRKKTKMKMVMKRDELPFSLIASEILPRIPGKSDIGRCRCVCKEWRSFLSTSTFNRLHLQRHVTIDDYKVLLFDGSKFHTVALNERIPNEYNPYPTNPYLSILASFDGLVCLTSIQVPGMLAFWNPFTDAYKTLSSFPGSDYGIPSNFTRDPVAFYKDPCTNDYRLLCMLTGHGDGGLCGAFVYSHRLDSWRELSFGTLVWSENFCAWSPATLCGQCLYFTLTYFIDRYSFDDDEIRSDSWVISFDVKTEMFRKIPVPSIPREAREYCGLCLVVLDGCLHLCVTYKIDFEEDYYAKYGDLWRLDDDEWVKVAAFNNDRRRQERICTASTGNWLAVMDQDADSFKKMNTEDFTTYYHYFANATREYRSKRIIYVQSLVSPNL